MSVMWGQTTLRIKRHTVMYVKIFFFLDVTISGQIYSCGLRCKDLHRDPVIAQQCFCDVHFVLIFVITPLQLKD